MAENRLGISSDKGSLILDRITRGYQRWDTWIYAIFCVFLTCYASGQFYGYMMVQTGGQWSAPLDDVFIHFDYARAMARGYPFQWSEGNGYSSGNTSLSYPFFLALGYWLGFRSLNLMFWAAIVANCGVITLLLSCGRLASRPGFPVSRQTPLNSWQKYLLPPALLSLGALNWTLFSGMENALHLGVWGLSLVATLRQAAAPSARAAIRRAWTVGLLGALLVATRPESASCVLLFGLFCAFSVKEANRRTAWLQRLHTLVAIGLPAVALLCVHAIANITFTGEWSANGSIAKLFLNNPYMSGADKWERYLYLLDWIIHRLTEHHFADVRPWGWLVPITALVPLFSRRTRAIALLLWAQIFAWILLVSLNNQLRWQNARYAMPAVAWLLMLAAIGITELVRRGSADVERARARFHHRSWLPRLALATMLVGLYGYHQAPNMKDQIWFFGRACRNILEQHVTAGRILKELRAKRVLVGDAGALMYVSDRPGLDLIGLGGFSNYPFARSAVHGLGASIELIERIPVDQRPDLMAIYPSWWGDLPTYFGHLLTAVPVSGNVICGGAEKVLYRADWRPLDRTGQPHSLTTGEEVVDELDIADLLSERQHEYRFPRPSMGFVQYRVLPAPKSPRKDLFDAGRIIPANQTEVARLKAPNHNGRLIVRLAPTHANTLELSFNGDSHATIKVEPQVNAWQELSTPIPDGLGPTFELSITPKHGESVHYHVWVVHRVQP